MHIEKQTQLYFMYYSLVVKILFITRLYKPAFATYCFSKLGYRLSVFLCFLSVLCFKFGIILKDFTAYD